MTKKEIKEINKIMFDIIRTIGFPVRITIETYSNKGHEAFGLCSPGFKELEKNNKKNKSKEA
jgi:hypothetical protein